MDLGAKGELCADELDPLAVVAEASPLASGATMVFLRISQGFTEGTGAAGRGTGAGVGAGAGAAIASGAESFDRVRQLPSSSTSVLLPLDPLDAAVTDEAVSAEGTGDATEAALSPDLDEAFPGLLGAADCFDACGAAAGRF